MSYATKINLAIPPVFPYLVYMTIKELKEIIALNIDAAEAGSLQAQGQVVEAQAEIERLESLEHLAMANRNAQADEQFEADMLDLGGCSDPYAPPSPFSSIGSGW